uniref:Putative odorant binding protein 24 n=1 Tax=Conopomorpha sinensis TaxID=940481 RepID=A0A649ZUH8_9NEOP|nr:putative odorant binding protein 24 [Conopomorpha sinensis]
MKSLVFCALFLEVFALACSQNIPVTPPQVRCGETPSQMFRCLGNPKTVKTEVASKCSRQSECDKMKCIFENSGWSVKGVVNRQIIRDHFDQFAKDHPEWLPAVTHVKAACLTSDIPTQGVYLNCPAYDVVHCIFTGFLRKAQPSQWGTSPECAAARQFAAACPVCPEDCYAPAIPTGSCNACLSLPNTP